MKEIIGKVNFCQVNDSGYYDDDFAYQIGYDSIYIEDLLKEFIGKKIKLTIEEIEPENICDNCGKELYEEETYYKDDKKYCYECYEE